MAACDGATLVSLITFLPIYLQVVRGTDPSDTGFLLLPLTALIAVGSMFTGRMITRTGRTAIFPSFGLPVVDAGRSQRSRCSRRRLSLTQLPFLFCLIALTTGTAMPVVQTTVQMLAGRSSSAPPRPPCSSRVRSARRSGTAIVGAVLFGCAGCDRQRYGPAVRRHSSRPGRKRLARGSTRPASPSSSAQIADAFRAAFLTIATFAAIGALLAWTHARPKDPMSTSTNRPLATRQRSRPAAEGTVFAVLLAISFSHLLNDMIQSLLPAIYPILKDSYQLDFGQIGVITLAFQITASLLQPRGRHRDGPRPQPFSLPVGMGLTLIGLLLLSTAGSYPLLLLAAALVGSGSSVFHPESAARRTDGVRRAARAGAIDLPGRRQRLGRRSGRCSRCISSCRTARAASRGSR